MFIFKQVAFCRKSKIFMNLYKPDEGPKLTQKLNITTPSLIDDCKIRYLRRDHSTLQKGGHNLFNITSFSSVQV